YLIARITCQQVVSSFVAEGGDYRPLAVLPEELDSGNWKALQLSDGSKLAADRYVFACGPWLGQLFPQTIGNRVRSTKQDVFFFGVPEGDSRMGGVQLPVWAEQHEPFMYGIPGNLGRGFKI